MCSGPVVRPSIHQIRVLAFITIAGHPATTANIRILKHESDIFQLIREKRSRRHQRGLAYQYQDFGFRQKPEGMCPVEGMPWEIRGDREST